MRVLLISVIGLALLVACAPQAAEITTADLTEDFVDTLPTEARADVLVTLEGETQLYTDRELGFSFEFPTTWTVQGQEGTSVVLLSFAPGDAVATADATAEATADVIPAELPEGATRIDFATLSADITTLEVGLQAVRDSIAQNGQTVESDTEVRLFDNRRAYRITTSSATGPSPTLLVTEINGRVLLITAQGDTGALDLIQDTLRDIN
jgi:hypothetical protein